MKTNGLLFTTCLFLATTAWGDTLKLKDGTVYEGTIILDTPAKVVFSIEVRPGIKEEKTFAGTDVSSVTKSTPEDKAFEALEGFVPTPDRLSAADYKRMVNKLEAFLNAFEKGRHRRDASRILKTLKSERDLVEAGGIKLGGKWLTKDELESDAYEIDAQIIASDMMKYAADGPAISALRKFEELKQGYSGSNAYPRAIEAVKEVLTGYAASVKRDFAQVEARSKTRENELLTLSTNQQKAAREQIERLAKNYAKRLEYEKKTKTKWLTLEPYHEEPMETTLRTIESELKALEDFDPKRLKPLSETYRNAWAAASARNRTRVEELAKELRSARVQPKYLSLLEKRLLAKEAEAKAAGEPEFTEEDPSEADAEATPSETAEMPEEEEKPAESDNDEESAASDDEEEESGGALRPILFGVIGLVILIALVTALTGKKKKES